MDGVKSATILRVPGSNVNVRGSSDSSRASETENKKDPLDIEPWRASPTDGGPPPIDGGLLPTVEEAGTKPCDHERSLGTLDCTYAFYSNLICNHDRGHS